MIEENSEIIQLIVFNIGNEEYAVPIMNVQEIIIKQAITRIPKMPVWVEGVINLRNDIIPIIDGKKKFMLANDENQKSSHSRIMVINTEDKTFGLTVDRVSEVIYLNVENIKYNSSNNVKEPDYLLGLAKYENRLLILLNSNGLIDHADIEQLKKITQILKSDKELLVT